jgi:hypothetical protein
MNNSTLLQFELSNLEQQLLVKTQMLEESEKNAQAIANEYTYLQNQMSAM